MEKHDKFYSTTLSGLVKFHLEVDIDVENSPDFNLCNPRAAFIESHIEMQSTQRDLWMAF